MSECLSQLLTLTRDSAYRGQGQGPCQEGGGQSGELPGKQSPQGLLITSYKSTLCNHARGGSRKSPAETRGHHGLEVGHEFSYAKTLHLLRETCFPVLLEWC